MIYDLFKYLTENKIECAGNFDLTSAILHHGLVNQKIPVLCVRSHDFAIVSVKFSSFEIILSQKVAKLTCEVLYCDNSPEFIGSFLSMFIPDYSAEHLSQFKSDLKDLFDKKIPLLFITGVIHHTGKVIEILKLGYFGIPQDRKFYENSDNPFKKLLLILSDWTLSIVINHLVEIAVLKINWKTTEARNKDKIKKIALF